MHFGDTRGAASAAPDPQAFTPGNVRVKERSQWSAS